MKIKRLEIESKKELEEWKEKALYSNVWVNNLSIEYINSLNILIRPKRWRSYMQTTAYSELCSCNKDKFKEIFGRQHFTYTTWYRGWYWLLDFKGNIIYANTSIRGTSYFLIEKRKGAHPSDLRKDMYQFIIEMCKLLPRQELLPVE